MKASIAGNITVADASKLSDVCIDSRQAGQGSLFFALKGERTDGHNYVSDALSRGSVAVVSAESELGAEGGILLVVRDPLTALGELAGAYRKQFSLHVIAITGSVGKTSTKELTAHILRTRYNVLATEKNFNNEIGVPLTLFGLDRGHSAAVLELGMRAAGEIRALAEIVQPSIAVITNIGHAHLELLGSREAIASAKAEVLELLPVGGTAILPKDLAYPEVVFSSLRPGTHVVQVGQEDSDAWADDTQMQNGVDGTTEFTVHLRIGAQTARVSMHAPGVHQRENALLAIAVGDELGISLTEAAAALATWQGAAGRMTLRAGLRGITVLDDCYNAGPESMFTALKTLRGFGSGQVAILGDMRELGSAAEELHRMVGRAANAAELRLLITVGPLAEIVADEVLRLQPAAAYAPEVIRFRTTEECSHSVLELIQPEEAVLVKGSRAMQMEKIVWQLTGEQRRDYHG